MLSTIWGKDMAAVNSKICRAKFRIWSPNFFGCLNQKSEQLVSAKFNSTPILKIASENIEKCKGLWLFGIVNFAIIANRDVGNFVDFWQFVRLSIHISTSIKL